jgi:hypothetical protein
VWDVSPNFAANLTVETWTFVLAINRYPLVMKKGLNPDKVLSVRCPTCGAAPRAQCELNTGNPRSEHHRDRPSFANARTDRDLTSTNVLVFRVIRSPTIVCSSLADYRNLHAFVPCSAIMPFLR